MHIVIIEDEQGIRQELSQLLRDALYKVTAIENFEQLSEKVLELQPDLVLLDLNLPGISGFEVCGEIRKHSEVPIIFVTSRTDAMDELTGMVKGGDDYITKPFLSTGFVGAYCSSAETHQEKRGGNAAVFSQRCGTGSCQGLYLLWRQATGTV